MHQQRQNSQRSVIIFVFVALALLLAFLECAPNQQPLETEEIQDLRRQFREALDENLPEKAEEVLVKLEELGAKITDGDRASLAKLRAHLAEVEASFEKAVQSMDLEEARLSLGELEKLKSDTREQVSQIQKVEAHHIELAYPGYERVTLPEKSLERFHDEAERGNHFAQMSLGFAYYHGKGVVRDYKKAARWFTLAAEGNYAMGQVFLGELYVAGNGVPLSPLDGAKWVRKAADQGFAIGQLVLAAFYVEGIGVEKSLEESRKWLKKAAEQGNEVAIRQMETAPEIKKKPEPFDKKVKKVEAVQSEDALRDAEHLDLGENGRNFRTSDGITFPMARIFSGTFNMGSPEDEPGRNRLQEYLHEVTISKDFWMGRTEVTQGQWQAIMGNNPSSFRDPNKPVEQVSWDDVGVFLEKLNKKMEAGVVFRLPTEAEWEYACRAGSTGGHAGDIELMAWYSSNSLSTTHPVAKKESNAWGLYDMHGNVSEWVQDKWDNYPDDPTVDPIGKKGEMRIYRGGGWSNLDKEVRSGSRRGDKPGVASSNVGFRLVCTVN